MISIHAPRAGSDEIVGLIVTVGMISIHAPRAGSDSCYTAGLYNPAHFNPRSPCGERHDRDRHSGSRDAISIHAPRAGGDDVQYIHYSLFMEFQSTPPVRGATGRRGGAAADMGDFNPRPPCGGRLVVEQINVTVKGFQSTPPVRGATFHLRAEQCYHHHFNPRPPCGGRHNDAVITIVNSDFNPRPPCGGRRGRLHAVHLIVIFQSTPPVRGATHVPFSCCFRCTYFNPRPPCGGRQEQINALKAEQDISIHAPRAGGDNELD